MRRRHPRGSFHAHSSTEPIRHCSFQVTYFLFGDHSGRNPPLPSRVGPAWVSSREGLNGSPAVICEVGHLVGGGRLSGRPLHKLILTADASGP